MTEETITSRADAESNSTIFAPAVWAMRQLGYSGKFILIGLLMLLPFALVGFLAFKLSTERIDKDQRELYGVTYMKPIVRLLRDTENHGIWEVATAAGDMRYVENLDGIPGRAENPGVRKMIEDDFKELEKVEKEYGAVLNTGESLKLVQAQWKEIRAQGSTDSNRSLNAHLKLYDRISGLILIVVNNSNLVHDPDLDSYWLMHAYTQAAPRITINFTRANMILADISARNTIQTEDRLAASALYFDGVSAVNDLVSVDLRCAAGYTAKTNTALAANVKKYSVATQARATEFLNFIRDNVRNSSKMNFDPDTARNVSDGLAATMKSFFDSVQTDLETTITNRMNQYSTWRDIGAVVAAVALLLLGYIFIGFYISVRGSVSALEAATSRMIAGTTETFTLKTRDELARVARSYNDINSALVEARDLKYKTEEENRVLQENILQTLQIVAQAADGDLTVRAPITEGPLGNVSDAFNQMLSSWREVLSEIRSLTEKTQHEIGQIVRSSERVATGATQQFREISSANGSMQKMNLGIKRVSTNAETAADAARRVQKSALAGSESVQSVMRGMDTLRANVQAGAKKIKSLGDRSMEITSIVGTIAKISDQTNMLALNAAVEAARAGEHGRGFSVVAEEIRKLAERTANATQEIEKLVDAIQLETNDSVAAIEQQTVFVEQEVSIVGHTGDALRKISDVSTQSTNLAVDISETAKTQVEDTLVIVQTMERVSDIARQTKIRVTRTLRTVQGLLGISNQLSTSVSKFRLETTQPPLDAHEFANGIFEPAVEFAETGADN